MDYVFIDCPPSLGLLTLNAMVAAAEVLIPIQCEFYALEGLTQLLETSSWSSSHLNARPGGLDDPADDVRRRAPGSPTRSPPRCGRTSVELVLDAVIPRSVRVSEAPGFGQTVVTYDPSSRGARGVPGRGIRSRHAGSRALGQELRSERPAQEDLGCTFGAVGWGAASGR